ncbi:MAG: hemerythrin domain-containing protein [Acidimicrobiales bacterium]
MTITPTSPTTTAALDLRPFEPIVVDLYRDIHKGLRAELFAATSEAGRLDPADGTGRAALASQVRDVIEVLVQHADHEDTHIGPALEAEVPALAERIAGEHAVIEARMDQLTVLADDVVVAGGADRALAVHRLYLELATFTAEYLEHQDVEERVVMPALQAVVGPEACAEIEHAIIASISPEDMARSLAFMLPAMDIDDRAELLGGMQAGAPAEVFTQVWGLAASVLAPVDLDALGRRLGIA